MNDFTLEELCWLWDQADNHYAPPIAEKLLVCIEKLSPRPLSTLEIRELARKWRSEFERTR